MKRRIGLSIACLGFVAAAGISAAAAHKANAGPGADAIKPFRVHFPAEALADLKRRIAATRWPDKEIVTDQSQGVQLATIQKLARYWAEGYDWRRCEAQLNALPQFTTEVDGLDKRSRGAVSAFFACSVGGPAAISELRVLEIAPAPSGPLLLGSLFAGSEPLQPTL